MAVFNDATVGTSTGGTTPNFKMNRSSRPQLRKTQFNDGYMHRIKFGMNTNPRKWTLTWTAKDETDADAIEAFFDARADDAASFDWTPPNESTASKFIVEPGWNRRVDYANINTITATFQQVFEP